MAARLRLTVSVATTGQDDTPQPVFVLQAAPYDEWFDTVRKFTVTLLPVHLAAMRRLSLAPGTRLPSQGDIMIELAFEDRAPDSSAADVVLTHDQAQVLAQANKASRTITLMLEGKTGLFGKVQTAFLPGTWPAYVLDWDGILGYVFYVRSALQATQQNLDQASARPLLSALEERVEAGGPATGLYTEMGYICRCLEDWTQAIHYYREEITLNQQTDGRLGIGAMKACQNLGVVYKKRGEYDRALACFHLALSLNPNYFEALVSIAGLLRDQDLFLACLSRAARVRPSDPHIGAAIQGAGGAFGVPAERLVGRIEALARQMDLAQPLLGLVTEDAPVLLQRVIQ